MLTFRMPHGSRAGHGLLSPGTGGVISTGAEWATELRERYVRWGAELRAPVQD